VHCRWVRTESGGNNGQFTPNCTELAGMYNSVPVHNSVRRDSSRSVHPVFMREYGRCTAGLARNTPKTTVYGGVADRCTEGYACRCTEGQPVGGPMINPWWFHVQGSGWHCSAVCHSRKRIMANNASQWPLHHWTQRCRTDGSVLHLLAHTAVQHGIPRPDHGTPRYTNGQTTVHQRSDTVHTVHQRSDTVHTVHHGQPYGTPRTAVRYTTDSPRLTSLGLSSVYPLAVLGVPLGCPRCTSWTSV